MVKNLLMMLMMVCALTACKESKVTKVIPKDSGEVTYMKNLELSDMKEVGCLEGLVVVSRYSGNAFSYFYLRRPAGLVFGGQADFVKCEDL